MSEHTKTPYPEVFEDELTITSFLFGGWSWRASKFMIWRIFYDRSLKKYVSAKAGIWKSFGVKEADAAELAFIGDYTGELFKRIGDKLEDKITRARTENTAVLLDYEPLVVLAEMLSDPEFTDRRKERRGAIGGGPQVTKVYPFLRTMSYAVEWDVGGKFVYVLKGRVISDFELFTVPGLNPFDGSVRKPVKEADKDAVPVIGYSHYEE
ncbi:hypothetical protein [Methylobacterium sp. WL120]|uniref:hypothetical protein n=1 Tax=Methylobacterium sp. WL120 TaxID=2603887 RepID=UPI0011C85A15|nr:hypothetical protein [Methylobacterium sp. WL120]TXM62360.1 hypothetical protein FV229_22165 [Methylobacterium sp. WL120]